MVKEKQKLNNFALPVNITDNLIEWLPTNFWRDPTKKVCYLSIVDGYVIDRMIDKFNEGLKDIITDDTERKNHILENMIYGISSTESNTRRAKWLSQIKNIYTRNILKEDISDMPKFDFIVQNPPYNGSLHLDFLKKGYEMLSDNGQMIIIEPSTWLINVRKNGKAKTIYNPLKEILKGKVRKVIIENYNIQFRTDQYMPFAITYIDKTYNSDNIEYTCCGYTKTVKSLYDCNLIGNYDLIWSIFNKINGDMVKNHIYEPKKSEKIKGNYYIRFAGIIGGAGSQLCALFDPKRSNCSQDDANSFNFLDSARDILFDNNGQQTKCLQNYTSVLYHRYKNYISDIPLKSYDRGKKLTDKDAECITGTKQELENWKHFVFNNSLPLFITIATTIDQNNESLSYVPWLVDKKYTDQEIYEKFNFTEEEIKLIETTIKKYERNSPWFKRYICGAYSVENEEVQKFIEDLNNVKK